MSYCAIESFGSIGVSLFWAFVNSSVNVETAKSAFGLIIAGANLGSILGPTIAVTKVSKRPVVVFVKVVGVSDGSYPCALFRTDAHSWDILVGVRLLRVCLCLRIILSVFCR